jgi:hypothetical protein
MCREVTLIRNPSEEQKGNIALDFSSFFWPFFRRLKRGHGGRGMNASKVAGN